MKKQLLSTVTLALALIFIVPPQVLAGHIIFVDTDIDCEGYKVTIWAYVHAGYTLNFDATLSNYSGYYSDFQHSKVFQRKKRTVKAVFEASWDSVLCEDCENTSSFLNCLSV